MKPGFSEVADKRKSARIRCRWPAILHIVPLPVTCRLQDISSGGCRIRLAPNRVEKGMEVQLHVPSQKLDFFGTIAWVRYDEAGIQFTAWRDGQDVAAKPEQLAHR